MPTWLKIALGVAAGVAVVIGLIVWLALWLTSGVIEPVHRQLAALKAGDMDAAYAETSEAFRQATPLEKFTAFVGEYPILKDYAVYSFSSRSIENSVGHVSGTLTSATGGVTPIEERRLEDPLYQCRRPMSALVPAPYAPIGTIRS